MTMTHNQLLIVEDDDGFRNALAAALSSRGFSVTPVPNGSSALAWLSSHACDLMLLDLKLTDMSGMDVLREVCDEHPGVEVVLLTGHGTIDTAIEAIRMGAFHYLTKPCPTDEVELTLQKARERRVLLERTTILQDGLALPDLGESFVGRSPAYHRIVRLIDQVARADSTVLIEGETGVGKELVAKLVHNRSPRRDEPFVVVDCGSLNDNLLQSELFGHEKGAYTGAVRQKHGLFSAADGGTIFLDEIGDVSPALQVGLLRVLETRRFRRLGGTAETSVDIRVLAATNRDLAEQVAKGHFREDLFYRLNTIRIEVPPLRERVEDIACLAAHFVRRFNERFSQDKRLSPEALEVLTGYSWPGNVRQLMHTVEQAIVVGEEAEIISIALPATLRSRGHGAGPDRFATRIVPLREVERQYIQFVIRQMDGHRARAARALGIGERSLYRKLKSFGIE